MAATLGQKSNSEIRPSDKQCDPHDIAEAEIDKGMFPRKLR
jgi:hypothetical protein